MKNTVTLLFAATTIALAVVCAVQSRKAASLQTQLGALRGDLEARSQEAEEAQAAQQRSEQQRQDAAREADELAAQLRARQLAATNLAVPAPAATPAPPEAPKPGADRGGFGKMLSTMMQDPDTREFIRNQQRMMMDQLYAPLVKQMGLTPEEAARFKDLLADNMVKSAEKASSMFGGPAATNRTEMLSSLTAEQKRFDELLKGLLGDARYTQYKEYQETLGERTMLNQFKQQAGSDYNLSDPQTEALLTFMKEEKKSVAASTGLPLNDTSQDPAKMQALLADDKTDQLLQAQETISQRVYERARTILSPEQLQTLGKFQTNQMQMTRMGLSMARKMFAPDQPAAPAATPNPPAQ